MIETDNIINDKNGGYENVSEYIPIAQPNAATLSKLDELQPSSLIGDRMSLYQFSPSFLHNKPQ